VETDVDGFTRLEITADMDAAPWTDLGPGVIEGVVERVGLLRNGTTGGRAVVALAIRLSSGQVAIAQTTWRLFNTGARSLAQTEIARGEPVE
jgi:hypothetical protein